MIINLTEIQHVIFKKKKKKIFNNNLFLPGKEDRSVVCLKL